MSEILGKVTKYPANLMINPRKVVEKDVGNLSIEK